MNRLMLFVVFVFTLLPPASAQPVITIDPSVRYQTIRGFGGSMAFSEAFLNTMPQSAFDHLVWRLFEDLRVGIVRVRMRNEIEPANDNGNPDSINWGNVHALPDTAVIRLIRAARVRGNNVQVLVTPWSPPSWIKTNDTTINGGHLRVGMEAELAEWVRIFLLLWENQYGLPIQLLSIQNEPSYVATYESCIYTPAEMNRALRSVVPRLRAWGFDSLQIIAPDDLSAEGSLTFADSLLLVPDVRAMLTGFAVHNYSTVYSTPTSKVSLLQNIKQRCTSASVPVWHTEYGNLSNYAAGSLAEAVLEAWHWIVALNDLGSSTYLHWQLAASTRSNSNPLGTALVQFHNDNSTFYIPRKYFFVKQFSRFIRPGMVRINLTGLPASVLGTAFHDGANGVTVLENLNSTAQSVRLSWPGADTLALWRTSRTDTCIQLPPLVRNGSFFDLTMPDSSIVSLVGTLQGTNDVASTDQSIEYHLFQNYPNPFNPSTQISFSIPHSSFVNLAVFDILGRQVATLVDNLMQSGSHQVIFDAGTVSNGVYYYRMTVGNFSDTKKLVLIR